MGYDVTVSITGFEPVRLGSNPGSPTFYSNNQEAKGTRKKPTRMWKRV
jgi:hypothetical protein